MELERVQIKKIKQWEHAVDLINQVAVIRTVFHDGTSQDTAIPKDKLRETIQNLELALRRFETADSQPKQ